MQKLNIIPYFGGKFNSLKWLYEHFPQRSEYRCFVDVFGGSGVVVLNHPNKGRGMNEIYNDVNGNVCNLFRVLRDREKAEELAELIALTPFSREEKYDCWEHYKNPELTDVERARMYLVVMKQGFFGTEDGSWSVVVCMDGLNANRVMLRFNKYPSIILSLIDRMKEIGIENYSYNKILKIYNKPEVFMYCDPPYYKPSCKTSGTHYRDEFTHDKHVAFLAQAKDLCCKVMISGYPSELYDTELKDWYRVEKGKFTSSAAGKNKVADGKAPKATEVLWMNYNPKNDLFNA